MQELLQNQERVFSLLTGKERPESCAEIAQMVLMGIISKSFETERGKTIAHIYHAVTDPADIYKLMLAWLLAAPKDALFVAKAAYENLTAVSPRPEHGPFITGFILAWIDLCVTLADAYQLDPTTRPKFRVELERFLILGCRNDLAPLCKGISGKLVNLSKSLIRHFDCGKLFLVLSQEVPVQQALRDFERTEDGGAAFILELVMKKFQAMSPGSRLEAVRDTPAAPRATP
jgi:hypothetical protein